MTSLSLEKAKAISQKYSNYNKIMDELTFYNEDELSETQACTALAVMFMRSIQKKKTPKDAAFGAYLTEQTYKKETFISTTKNETTFLFQEIPKVVIAALGIKQDNCHQNCINACVNNLPSHSIIHTAVINYLPYGNNNPNGTLHSFVELGNVIFDLDLGLRAMKETYYTFFDVKEISSVKAKDINNDFNNKTIEKLSKKNINSETYLMAREDCVKLVSKDK